MGTDVLAHDVDEAGEFGRLFAAGCEDGEQGGGFNVGRLAGEDLASTSRACSRVSCGAVFGEWLEKSPSANNIL